MAKKQKQQRQPVRKAETEKKRACAWETFFKYGHIAATEAKAKKALQEEQDKQQEKQRAEELERKKA
ncbi:hypothetical protein GCM10020331_042160 [Ectobacillus funiculus]